MAPRAIVFAILSLGALASVRGQVHVRKCCDGKETLDQTGRRCVPQNPTSHTDTVPEVIMGVFQPYPYDKGWIQKWLPAGLPFESIKKVSSSKNAVWRYIAKIKDVNRSSLWNSSEVNNDDYWKGQVVFDDESVVLPRREGGVKYSKYSCVDSVYPNASFVLLHHDDTPAREVGECCSKQFGITMTKDQKYQCEGDDVTGTNTSPSGFDNSVTFHESHSFFRRCLDPDVLIVRHINLTDIEKLSQSHESQFSSHRVCADDNPNNRNGINQQIVATCVVSRRTRGVYWMSRSLACVSILLLTAALVVIACKRNMRTSVHGWALGCHAVCRLLFNLCQVIYFLTISNEVNSMTHLSGEMEQKCMSFGFPMYFLLTAANFWLTALCINMASGFRKPLGARGADPKWRRFLWLCICAWGLPMLFTIACVTVFNSKLPQWDWNEEQDTYTLPWYRPTLLETRTCFAETVLPLEGNATSQVISRKEGTAFYFYAPMALLVLINIICNVYTGKRVHVLRARGDANRQNWMRRIPKLSAPAETQSLVIFAKMVLAAGALDFLLESVAWATCGYEGSLLDALVLHPALYQDHALAYYTVGLWADLLRAVSVLWLAGPERSDLQVLRETGRAAAKRAWAAQDHCRRALWAAVGERWGPLAEGAAAEQATTGRRSRTTSGQDETRL